MTLSFLVFPCPWWHSHTEPFRLLSHWQLCLFPWSRYLHPRELWIWWPSQHPYRPGYLPARTIFSHLNPIGSWLLCSTPKSTTKADKLCHSFMGQLIVFCRAQLPISLRCPTSDVILATSSVMKPGVCTYGCWWVWEGSHAHFPLCLPPSSLNRHSSSPHTAQKQPPPQTTLAISLPSKLQPIDN